MPVVSYTSKMIDIKKDRLWDVFGSPIYGDFKVAFGSIERLDSKEKFYRYEYGGYYIPDDLTVEEILYLMKKGLKDHKFHLLNRIARPENEAEDD